MLGNKHTLPPVLIQSSPGLLKLTQPVSFRSNTIKMTHSFGMVQFSDVWNFSRARTRIGSQPLSRLRTSVMGLRSRQFKLACPLTSRCVKDLEKRGKSVKERQAKISPRAYKSNLPTMVHRTENDVTIIPHPGSDTSVQEIF